MSVKVGDVLVVFSPRVLPRSRVLAWLVRAAWWAWPLARFHLTIRNVAQVSSPTTTITVDRAL